MSHRIVSLIASATEIAAALGCGDQLVGRSHECDFPPEVAGLAVCSSARVDVHAGSLEIDRQVKAAVAQALSIYEVKTAELERLKPTVILTQTLCDVCAVSLKDVETAVCGMLSSRPQIVALGAMDLAGVWDDVGQVAEALQVPSRGDALVAECRRRMDALQAETASLPSPSVACIEWIDPLMAAGNWVPELVEIAGGRNVLGQAGQHSPYMTWTTLVEADPEVIVLMPCGFDIPRTVAELPALITHPQWQCLSAVRSERVFVTDGNQYFNRPGPRLVESAEILAEILHPGRFDFGHRGKGWIASL